MRIWLIRRELEVATVLGVLGERWFVSAARRLEQASREGSNR